MQLTISDQARRDIEDIYTYSYQKFGQQKARQYIRQIEQRIYQIRDNPRLSKNLNFIKQDLRSIIIFSHTIDYPSRLTSKPGCHTALINHHYIRESLLARTAHIERNTSETQIQVEVNLDGNGQVKLDTGLPFLEHMLDQIARHGLIDLTIRAQGDLHIDAHHTVEDIGITLGQAITQAIGNKQGIQRYGHAYVPLDEALSRVVLDLSGAWYAG